jgi:hypothetical protein
VKLQPSPRLARPALALAGALAFAAAFAAPAQAIEFSSSSTTGKGGLIIPFRLETPKIGPISAEVGLRFVPTLSNFLGPAGLTKNFAEVTSSLFDVNGRVYYHQPLADVEFLGRINPVIAPYLGARYLAVPTTEGSASFASGLGGALSVSQFTGLDYGVRAYSELPLGFSAQAHLGLTTLVSGAWDTRQNSTEVTASGKVAAGGTTLPAFGIGAGWSLFNVLSLSVGYDVFALPTQLRSQSGSLSGGQTFINSLSLGVRLLALSF